MGRLPGVLSRNIIRVTKKVVYAVVDFNQAITNAIFIPNIYN
jgi:hypothetical protein